MSSFKSTVLSSLFIFLLFSFCGLATAKDVYKNIAELQKVEKENVDYKIVSQVTASPIAIIAIHGGKIEKGSSEVASTLSTLGAYNLYLFEGIKKGSNKSLHITSSNFDEKIGRAIVAKSKVTFSIHGMKGQEKETHLGGLDTTMKQLVKKHLVLSGFIVKDAEKELAGTDKENIVNDNLSKKGVQLELTTALRNSFLKGSKAEEELKKYCAALKSAILEFDSNK